MTASLPPALGERAAPFVVEAEAAPVPGGWPRGGVTRLALPNRHLEYAITWFGLAAALIAVFALYARRRLSQAGSAKDNAGVADQTGSV
jgi:surfeit locus 1 family protein